MSKSKSTKKAFISSVITLLLSCVMLLGTTFAWFTDNISSGKNRIISGNLEIDLLMYKKSDYVSIADGKGDIFAEANGGKPVYWEPGKTEIVFIAVENTGTLALKYDFKLNVTDGKNKGLVGALEYAVLEGVKAKKIEKNWSAIKSYEGARCSNLSAGTIEIAEGKKLNNKNDTHYYAIAVHMHDNASQGYQGGEIKIDVSLLATQAPYEEDSFGADYDNSAKNDKIKESITVTKSNIKSVDLTKNNTVYKFKGEFDSLTIKTKAGLSQTFDGSGITGNPKVVIYAPGILGSYTETKTEKSGNYTITGFNAKELNVYGFNTQLKILKNHCEFIHVCGGNLDLDITGNTVDAKSQTHSLSENGEPDSEYGIYLYVIDYNLKFNENTVKNTVSHAVVINGRQTETGFDVGGTENTISEFSGNNITVNSTTKEQRAALEIWDCAKYAPSGSTEFTSAAKELAKMIKTENTYQLGETHLYFDFNGVKVLNIE